MILTIKVGMKV